jgi:Kelch motif/IPT/TIG domain
MRNVLLSVLPLFFCFAACKKSAEPPRPVITGFSPSNGSGGTAVEIYGHFDSAVRQESILFNGVPAVTFSPSDSEIFVFVPAGVTTGKITVTVNNLSSTTDSDFVVLPGTWTQMAPRPSNPTGTFDIGIGVGFAIGNYGYMGFGTNNGSDFSDLYRYDPTSNTWTTMPSLGIPMEDLASMVIGDKAYVGIGESRELDTITNVFYEFDPSTDTWTRKADFPGVSRQNAFAFSIGGMGYIALGFGPTAFNYLDVWQYDPSADKWTQKNNFPANGPVPGLGTAFSPDNQVGYIMGTYTPANSRSPIEVVWRYDPVSDNWTQMHNLPTQGMAFPSAMVVNGTGYVLGGSQECWSYNQAADSWTQVAFFGYRVGGSAFSINGIGYYGMGEQRFTSMLYEDFWKFTP